jgi:hypothetical protein
MRLRVGDVEVGDPFRIHNDRVDWFVSPFASVRIWLLNMSAFAKNSGAPSR